MNNVNVKYERIKLIYITNPYINYFKYINYDFFNDKKVSISKVYLLYYIYSKIDCSDNEEYKKICKDFHTQIMNLQTDDIEIYNLNIYKLKNIVNDNKIIYDKQLLIDNYKNEINRILKIHKIFSNEYLNLNYKTDHLTKFIKDRPDKTSCCDIEEYINQFKKYNLFKEYIKTDFNNILLNNNKQYKINDNHISLCYILTIINNLFDNYLKILFYCINFLKNNEINSIRNLDDFIYKIDTNLFQLKDNDAIIINHLNIIKNVIVINNNTKNDGEYVKLYNTSKRNNILFL